jgi:DNA-directed RNA polymerase subunit K/omega
MTLAKTHYADTIHKVGGYYRFVTIVNRRLKELRNGMPPMLQPDDREDQIDLIVREIDANLLELGQEPG